MDSQTRQKIPIIIEKHILHTKIGYLAKQLAAEKRKCTKIDHPEEDGSRSIVYIENTPLGTTKEIRSNGELLEI